MYTHIKKIYGNEKRFFTNVEDAIKYIHETNFRDNITIYDSSIEKCQDKVLLIYDEIKKYNKDKPLNEQILPTNPYAFRGIYGCIGVQCYEIGINTYERNHNCIAISTGYNSSVLDTSKEKADLTPSFKAFSSLVTLFMQSDLEE